MRSRELQSLLANLSGRLHSDIDARMRTLRAMNEITTGPRGILAPHMNAAEWAFHVLALVARRPGDSGEITDRLHKDCKHVTTAETAHLFQSDRPISVVALLAYAIEHGLRWLGTVEIDESGRFAFVDALGQDGERQRLFFSVDPSADAEFVEATSLASRFVIGGATIMMLHRQFAEDAAALAAPEQKIAG